MHNDGRRMLVSDITSSVARWWEQWQEPISLAVIQARYISRVKSQYGKAATVSWFVCELERLKLLKVLMRRSGGLWLLPVNHWANLDLDGQRALLLSLERLSEPRSRRAWLSRLERLEELRASDNLDTGSAGLSKSSK